MQRLSNKAAMFGAAVLTLGLYVSAPALASPVYVQNFSSNTNGWNGTIALAPQSGSSDGQYAVVTNVDNDYQPGYGDAGYTTYNGLSGTYVGPFTQSMDIYIDTAWTAPTNASVPAFWLDMSPSDATGTAFDYAAENSFQFYVPGTGSVNIGATGGTNNWTINTSGWYTFAMTFSKGASAIDPVQIELNVLTQSGTSLGTVDRVANNALGYDPDSSQLGTGGYGWLTVWQNGFAGDLLGIDNLRSTAGATAVPAPLSIPGGQLIVLGLGVLGLIVGRRKLGASA